MKFPKVSIIILNRDGKEFIIPCLKSVLKTEYPNFEVIVVDNGSKDGSPQIIEKKFGRQKNFKLIKSPINLGFAGGNNRGGESASGVYLMFLNNDTKVRKEWLKSLIKAAESYPRFGAGSPKQLSLVKKERIDALGGTLDRFGWSKKEGYKEKDQGQYDQMKEVFYAQGSCLLVKKNLFEKVGRFDEDYVIYYEEVDLCWRIRLFGYKVLFIPQSVIYHFGGGWQKKQPKNPFFYLLRRNHLMTLMKNYNGFNLIKRLPIVLLFNLFTAVFFLFKRDFERSKAYLVAIVSVFRHLPRLLKKRRFVQNKIRKIEDKELEKLFEPKILFFEQWFKPERSRGAHHKLKR